MKTKRGQQDHETMIKDDFLKVLQRCFELEAKGKETVDRGVFWRRKNSCSVNLKRRETTLI